MSPAPMPYITALYAGLFALILVFLGVRVIVMRRDFKVGIGDGGQERLARGIRVHGNAVEWGVAALLLLLVAELTRAPVIMLHCCGAVFIVARVLHSVGLTQTSSRSSGRALGMVATVLVIIVLALWNIWAFLRVAAVL
jgi:uncharacterized membrane protein YecN with MAPEG domain